MSYGCASLLGQDNGDAELNLKKLIYVKIYHLHDLPYLVSLPVGFFFHQNH